MTGKWHEYWRSQLVQIKLGLARWRKEGFARTPIEDLGKVSDREDLYSGGVTVASLGPIRGGGQRHRLELGLVIAEQLEEGETVTVRIRGKDGPEDYLEFSAR